VRSRGRRSVRVVRWRASLLLGKPLAGVSVPALGQRRGYSSVISMGVVEVPRAHQCGDAKNKIVIRAHKLSWAD
jgi:hypothetical protein